MNKEYYNAHRNEILEKVHKYKMNNKDKIKEYNKKYYEKTRKNKDVRYRIVHELNKILGLMQELNNSLIQMDVTATDKKSGEKYKYGTLTVLLREYKKDEVKK